VILLWNILYGKGYRTELNKTGQDTRKEGHNIERKSLRRVEDDGTENGVNKEEREGGSRGRVVA